MVGLPARKPRSNPDRGTFGDAVQMTPEQVPDKSDCGSYSVKSRENLRNFTKKIYNVRSFSHQDKPTCEFICIVHERVEQLSEKLEYLFTSKQQHQTQPPPQFRGGKRPIGTIFSRKLKTSSASKVQNFLAEDGRNILCVLSRAGVTC